MSAPIRWKYSFKKITEVNQSPLKMSFQTYVYLTRGPDMDLHTSNIHHCYKELEVSINTANRSDKSRFYPKYNQPEYKNKIITNKIS
jgi:hypothetical protein